MTILARIPRSRALWALIAIGTAVRLVVAFATYGQPFDMDSFGLVRDALNADPLRLYSASIDHLGSSEILRWPYPPAFFTWISASGALADATGIAFHGLIQIPAILADAAIAILVYAYLGLRAAPERTRLGAAALVAIGPSFAVVSGYHGQIDSLAILPALLALVVWERGPPGSRAVSAGLLIGLGAAIKTVPLLALIALLPSSRSVLEGAKLTVAAVALPLLLLSPFAVADPSGVATLADYSGAPGVGGLSLLLQPDLAADWLTGVPPQLDAASRTLYDLGGKFSLGVIAALAIFLVRFRPAPLRAATLMWLAIYAFSPNLFVHYAVWGLPFFLLAGYVWQVAAVEALLLVPTALVYLGPWSNREVAIAYVPFVLAAWAAALLSFAALARETIRAAPPPPYPQGVAARWRK